MKNQSIFSLIICIFLAACSPEIVNPKTYYYQQPTDLQDGIITQNINFYNIDTAQISRLTHDLIDEKLYNIHSVLIYKDNALFYEKYLCGKDKKKNKKLGIIKHDVNCLHDTRSISKSVVSACIGLAIERGYIRSLYEPIATYLPEIKQSAHFDTAKLRITIKDLLTMSSGLCWDEMGQYGHLLNDETKMDLSFNPICFVLNKSMKHQPNSVWNYSGGNTQLLAEIIRRTTGQSIQEFARTQLFEPLKIQRNEWCNLTVRSIAAAASGLRLTSRSLLKFGMLYLHEGTFEGKQILSSDWIKQSLTTHISRPDLTHFGFENGGYGLQFWTYQVSINQQQYHIAEAKGNGGQSVFICPELDLVLVITAGNYNETKYNGLPFQILKEYVLPALG